MDLKTKLRRKLNKLDDSNTCIYKGLKKCILSVEDQCYSHAEKCDLYFLCD